MNAEVHTFPSLTFEPLQATEIDTWAHWLHRQWHRLYDEPLPQSLTRERTVDSFAHHLRLFAGTCQVATQGQEPAGLCSSSANAIEDLWVEPRLQRRGIGTALLKHALQRFANKGYNSAQIGCESFNTTLQPFLTQHGWERIAEEQIELEAGLMAQAQVWSLALK